MKLKLSTVLYLILAIGLVGCGTGDKSFKVKEKIKIGISMSGLQEDRWINDLKNLTEECKKRKVDVIIKSADQNSDKQISQCQDLVSNGIDLLLIVAQDAVAASKIVEIANDSHVKVLCYDRMILNSNVDAYISFNNTKVGNLQGEALLKKVPKGRYVILSGSSTDSNSKLFLDGAISKLKHAIDSKDISVVYQSEVIKWDPNEAYNIINKLLNDGVKFDAILAPNDGTAAGCIKAIIEKTDNIIPITGQDGDKLAIKKIYDGHQYMTVFKDTKILAKRAIDLAEKLCKNENINYDTKINNNKIDVNSILLDPIAIYKENIEKELVETGYISKDFLK